MRLAAFLLVLGAWLQPMMAQEAARGPFDAKNFPLRDAHEGVTIAADPYLTPERAKSVFSKHAPNRVGVLPVELIVTNDSGRSVRINLYRCQLIVSRTKKRDPLPPSEVAEHLYRPSSEIQVPTPGRRPLPPRGKKKGAQKDAEEAEADFTAKAFRVRTIPAHSSARGFLYFDLGKPLELPAGAVFYVPEVVDESTGQALLYFEINLTPTPPQRPPTTP